MARKRNTAHTCGCTVCQSMVMTRFSLREGSALPSANAATQADSIGEDNDADKASYPVVRGVSGQVAGCANRQHEPKENENVRLAIVHCRSPKLALALQQVNDQPVPGCGTS